MGKVRKKPLQKGLPFTQWRIMLAEVHMHALLICVSCLHVIPCNGLVAQEILRMVIMGVISVQMALVGLIPYVGQFLATVHVSWVCALYSFEYKWALERKRLDAKVRHFENNWAYYTGFGQLLWVHCWPTVFDEDDIWFFRDASSSLRDLASVLLQQRDFCIHISHSQ